MKDRNLTTALVALAEHSIPVDVQELLVRGSPTLGIAPGALQKALDAVGDWKQRSAQQESARGGGYGGLGGLT